MPSLVTWTLRQNAPLSFWGMTQNLGSAYTLRAGLLFRGASTQWADSSEKANAKVVHLGWSSSCSSRMGTGGLGSSSAEKELGKLRANSTCQWCVLAVTQALLLAGSSKEEQPNNLGGHYPPLPFRHLVKKRR